jgi:hypothetical protein
MFLGIPRQSERLGRKEKACYCIVEFDLMTAFSLHSRIPHEA